MAEKNKEETKIKRKDKIRIASGQGFWGDLIDAPLKQATGGPVDYIMMDYLAEVTMSILQKQKLKDRYIREHHIEVKELVQSVKEKELLSERMMIIEEQWEKPE